MMDEAYKLIDDFNALPEDAKTKVADYTIDWASFRAFWAEFHNRKNYE